MTDGIVQNEFNRFINHYLRDPETSPIPITEQRLMMLQDNLIEKIKQEFDDELNWEGFRAYDNGYLKTVNNWKKLLIGDNQE